MTPAQFAAYEAKQQRETRARQVLQRRQDEVALWMETDFTSLAHHERFVCHIEAFIEVLRQESDFQTTCGLSSFMRELIDEDPALWAQTAIPCIEEQTPWYVDAWGTVKAWRWRDLRAWCRRKHEVLLLAGSWALFCLLLPGPLGPLWTAGMLLVGGLAVLFHDGAPFASPVFQISVLTFVFQAVLWQLLRLVF
jgi:hypothetical protein